jgi:hypothetical protein
MIKLTDLLKETLGNLKQQTLEYLESRKNTFTWGSSNHKLVLKMLKDVAKIQNDDEILPYLQQYTALRSSSPKAKIYPYAIQYMISGLIKQIKPQ